MSELKELGSSLCGELEGSKFSSVCAKASLIATELDKGVSARCTDHAVDRLELNRRLMESLGIHLNLVTTSVDD